MIINWWKRMRNPLDENILSKTFQASLHSMFHLWRYIHRSNVVSETRRIVKLPGMGAEHNSAVALQSIAKSLVIGKLMYPWVGIGTGSRSRLCLRITISQLCQCHELNDQKYLWKTTFQFNRFCHSRLYSLQYVRNNHSDWHGLDKAIANTPIQTPY